MGKNILPKVAKKIDVIVNEGIANYDIVPEIEKYLGHKLSDNQITLYLIYFAKPHGMKIAGTQYITDISNDFETILANAIHEMMHPPFSAENPRFTAARAKLVDDAFFQKNFANRNASYGYPTYEGFFEENCVDALEVVIREKFDLIKEGPRNYFRNHDGGADGLGAAIYSLIQQEDYVSKGESFEEFLVRMIESGKLAAGRSKSCMIHL